MRVYVVSFSPFDDSLSSVGGFEWRKSLLEAQTEMMFQVLHNAATSNLSFVHIDVPDDLTDDQITEWLDSNLALFEPTGNTYLIPPCTECKHGRDQHNDAEGCTVQVAPLDSAEPWCTCHSDQPGGYWS